MASCQPTSAWGKKDARWSAAITDVSQGGIRLVVCRRFEPGTGLGVEFPGQSGEEPYMVLAKVIHVRALPDGSWALGCKFISELGEDELRRLILPQQAAPSSKNLSETGPGPITPSQSPQMANYKGAVKGASSKLVVSNVLFQIETSAGGVVNCRVQRLSVPHSWPPDAGMILEMRKVIPQRPRPLLRLQVVRCWQESDCWALRCLLVNAPTDDFLQALRPSVFGMDS